MYRSVVEIGSGCGFLGLVVSNVTGPSSYTFTDCHEDVLALLQENIRINSKKNYFVLQNSLFFFKIVRNQTIRKDFL